MNPRSSTGSEHYGAQLSVHCDDANNFSSVPSHLFPSHMPTFDGPPFVDHILPDVQSSHLTALMKEDPATIRLAAKATPTGQDTSTTSSRGVTVATAQPSLATGQPQVATGSAMPTPINPMSLPAGPSGGVTISAASANRGVTIYSSVPPQTPLTHHVPFSGPTFTGPQQPPPSTIATTAQPLPSSGSQAPGTGAMVSPRQGPGPGQSVTTSGPTTPAAGAGQSKHVAPPSRDPPVLYNVTNRQYQFRVDSIFDFGYLVTANIEGRQFRGILMDVNDVPAAYSPPLAPAGAGPVLALPAPEKAKKKKRKGAFDNASGEETGDNSRGFAGPMGLGDRFGMSAGSSATVTSPSRVVEPSSWFFPSQSASPSSQWEGIPPPTGGPCTCHRKKCHVCRGCFERHCRCDRPVGPRPTGVKLEMNPNVNVQTNPLLDSSLAISSSPPSPFSQAPLFNPHLVLPTTTTTTSSPHNVHLPSHNHVAESAVTMSLSNHQYQHLDRPNGVQSPKAVDLNVHLHADQPEAASRAASRRSGGRHRSAYVSPPRTLASTVPSPSPSFNLDRPTSGLLSSNHSSGTTQLPLFHSSFREQLTGSRSDITGTPSNSGTASDWSSF